MTIFDESHPLEIPQPSIKSAAVLGHVIRSASPDWVEYKGAIEIERQLDYGVGVSTFDVGISLRGTHGKVLQRIAQDAVVNIAENIRDTIADDDRHQAERTLETTWQDFRSRTRAAGRSA